MHALLRHLEQAGFTAAPRLVGPGLDSGGREVLTFIAGRFTFRPPPGAVWFPWHGRDLGGPDQVIGHCDLARGTS